MIRIINITIALLGVFKFLVAQDPHFSQYFSSPLTLNPAATGKHDGNLRFASNFRNQWRQTGIPFKTHTSSLDFKLAQKSIAPNNTLGTGLLFMSDETGNHGYKSSYAGISFAFHKGLDEEGYRQLGVGFQYGYVNRRIDYNKLVFGNQLTTTGYDLSLPSNEFNKNVTSNFSDFNTGVLYTDSPNDDISYYVGVSMYHINRPVESFQDVESRLASRYTFQTGGYITASETIRIHWGGLYMSQAGNSQINIGGALSLNVNRDWLFNPTSVYIGVWNRLGKTINPYLGLEFAHSQMGFSYDIANPKALGSIGRNSAELSFIYTNFNSGRDKELKCPKF
jgi:type IX secretion system PorP/SprF family membrane protein